ncbi:MAG TPA: tRNA (guanosine(37)-N1)-methyltransferase TrmD [Syntrophorhabdaceae bacterium]|nr:tRNA (guanosine(37)-N1)-methyltransferase TrmD [Syntrophorhabdaceae bacterium]HPP06057.1 tRNA (guanosine(37)-N1)-methyltransferase TrmD [Syntrophorhabdaceae bacterium]
MIFTVLTLFPKIFYSPIRESILKKAQEKNLISFNIINIRDFAIDVHKTCDDTPYGGGPGMVMKIEPIYHAMVHTEKAFGKPYFILLTPQGKIFSQRDARRLSKKTHLCLICGRYEGIDERITNLVDEEISVGDYILSGGEIPALILIDAISRYIPGVLGNKDSVTEESLEEPLLEYPQYTRPEVFMDMAVPKVLLSGNHEEIRKWRRKESIKKTILRRPDLMERFTPSEEDQVFIKEIMEGLTE